MNLRQSPADVPGDSPHGETDHACTSDCAQFEQAPEGSARDALRAAAAAIVEYQRDPALVGRTLAILVNNDPEAFKLALDSLKTDRERMLALSGVPEIDTAFVILLMAQPNEPFEQLQRLTNLYQEVTGTTIDVDMTTQVVRLLLNGRDTGEILVAYSLLERALFSGESVKSEDCARQLKIIIEGIVERLAKKMDVDPSDYNEVVVKALLEELRDDKKPLPPKK